MGTDTVVAKSASQRGMAMFIVLGAIVLVTLFGYVGLNLAGRDQNLSGDLNDIKSRDEAAMASLQFSINRLIEDPDQLVTLLNGFISTGRGNGGQPTSTWVVFDPSTKAIALQKNEPDWLPLSTDANNQSAMKLQILGVGAGDSTAPVTDRKDSLGVHVSFRGLARGRRGDEKEVLAAYRIHGLSVDYRTDSTRYTIPNYAFYLGSFLNSSNLGTHVIGDVYIAGGNTLNATANDTVQGNFKWQGDFSTNANLDVDGIAYISGSLTTNSGFTIRFRENAGIGDGLKQVNAPIVAAKSLWIGGTGSAGTWNSGANMSIGQDLVFGPSAMIANIQSDITVGRDAWFIKGTTGTNSSGKMTGALNIGRDLIVGGDPAALPVPAKVGQFYSGKVTVGQNVIAPLADLAFSGGSTSGSVVAGQLYTRYSAWSMHIGSGKADIFGTRLGTTLPTGFSIGNSDASRVTALAWKAPPSLADLGINAEATITNVQQNPMDSLKVDEYSQVTPIVLSNAMMKLANPTTDGTIFNATTLNKLYTYLENSDQLHNGYMVLLLGSGFSISSLDNGDPIGFKGKALFVIEGSYDINSKWPNSKDSTNIQLICIRKGGELKSWGWLSGDFAGIFYWEHPPCKGINVNLSSPAPSKWWGGFLMGQHLPAGTPEPHFGYTPGNCPSGSPSYVQFNAGTTRLIKSDALYQDVGENLPGVLRPAQRSTTFNNEIINSTVKWAYFYKRSPLVRLVHDRPYFEPIGVFR